MKQLVCLSYTPWQKSPTRTQQLLTRLRDADILFIEPPATGANKSYRRPGRKVRPNVTVYTLPPLLGGQSEWRFFRRRNQARLSAFLLKILAKHRFRGTGPLDHYAGKSVSGRVSPPPRSGL